MKHKRHYTRNTPVGRLRRNADQISHHAKLALTRLGGWMSDLQTTDPNVLAAVEACKDMHHGVERLSIALSGLEKSGFVPPRKTESASWDVGQAVRLSPKVMPKYLETYATQVAKSPTCLDALVVRKKLDSGELVVASDKMAGPEISFIVRKSHLKKRRIRAPKTPAKTQAKSES